jgi:RNA polymerase sigma-70 factor, ECF subfamily
MTSGSPGSSTSGDARGLPVDRYEPSDAALLAEHVQGSPTAFGVLVSRHHDHLWAVALRMMHSPDDAADVLQDSMIKAFRAAPGFRGQAAVSTWLHRITVNAALDALRARSRTELLGLEPVGQEQHADRLGQRQAAPDAVATRETALDVTAALAAIPADQRAAVVLVDMIGFSVAEAAVALECPPGTVKSRCSRARSRLADMLAGYDPSTHGAGDSVVGNPAARSDVEHDGAASREPGARTEEQS